MDKRFNNPRRKLKRRRGILSKEEIAQKRADIIEKEKQNREGKLNTLVKEAQRALQNMQDQIDSQNERIAELEKRAGI